MDERAHAAPEVAPLSEACGDHQQDADEHYGHDVRAMKNPATAKAAGEDELDRADPEPRSGGEGARPCFDGTDLQRAPGYARGDF